MFQLLCEGCQDEYSSCLQILAEETDVELELQPRNATCHSSCRKRSGFEKGNSLGNSCSGWDRGELVYVCVMNRYLLILGTTFMNVSE